MKDAYGKRQMKNSNEKNRTEYAPTYSSREKTSVFKTDKIFLIIKYYLK
jgi:hypothetical protein